MKICLVIPAYNEEKRIERTLIEYSKFLRSKKLNFEILVVLNACKDDTLGIVKKTQKDNREIDYINLKKGGKGFAVIEGFKKALKENFDLIGFVDADMATSPKSYYDLIKNINNYDGVIASRGMKDSVVKTSFTRKLTNRGFNLVARMFLFLPYSDTQCGAKLFKKEALKSVVNEMGITQWAWDIDLLCRLKSKGFKIIEIPTVWEDKAGSKIKLIAPIQMFSAIIRLRLIYSPFKFIVKLYDRLPESIKLHHR